MRLSLLLGLAFLCFILGCGGGGGSPVSPPVSVTPSVSVDWPVRTRNVEAPSSGLSVIFEILTPGTGQTAALVSSNRSSALSAHTETYTFSKSISAGNYTLFGKFYAGTNLSGELMATVSSPVKISSNGSLQNPDGTALGAINFSGAVKSVVIAPNQTFSVGNQLQLVATAYDGNANVLALSPGSFTFAVTAGASVLSVTPDGIATAIGLGTASLTAQADGQISPAVTVTVAGSAHALRFSNITDSIQLTGGALNGACPLGSTFTIEAMVRPTSANGDIWQQWTDGAMDQRLTINDGSFQPVAFDDTFTATVPLPLNQWSHVAWCFDGTNFKLYQNGALVLKVPAPSGTNTTAVADACALGYNNSSLAEGTNQSFIGDLAGFRISNVALYSGSSYTPPKLPLQSSSSTLLLINPYSSSTTPTTFLAPGLQGITASLGAGGGATAPSWVTYSP